VRVEGIRLTGSGSRTIAKILGLFFENEFKAVARMMAAFYPARRAPCSRSAARARSTFASHNRTIEDYDRSGECAAGTGSFFDQQALRMRYSVEDVGDLVCARRLRRAHRRPLLGVRQERHDPRAAEGTRCRLKSCAACVMP
jgi:activator of 2-hydroxyglutaryl-CoA dehydratase